MPLIKGGKIVPDPWQHFSDDEELPADIPAIVSVSRWQAERDALLTRGGLLGIRLAPDQPPTEVARDLDHFALVAIDFPVFRDGRGFSYARLLRERHQFDGEIRAIGNVLRDQFLFMHRCGFDSFEVAGEGQADAWLQSISEISVWYQPATDSRVPVWRLRHRHPAPLAAE
jgi:uncharacterized protein (DUF934 family)